MERLSYSTVLESALLDEAILIPSRAEGEEAPKNATGSEESANQLPYSMSCCNQDLHNSLAHHDSITCQGEMYDLPAVATNSPTEEGRPYLK